MALAQGEWKEMCHLGIWRVWQLWDQGRQPSQCSLMVGMDQQRWWGELLAEGHTKGGLEQKKENIADATG